MNNQIGVVVGTIQGSIPCTPFHPKWVRYNQTEKENKIMARKRMVTRTVEQTTAEVMTIDVTTAEVQVRTYDIGGKYTDEDLLKKLQKIFQTDTLKLVHIESQSCEEVLLGMDEEEFIRLANVLPPRNANKNED